MCRVMPWQQGITSCEPRGEPEVWGVIPCCQGITQSNNNWGSAGPSTVLACPVWGCFANQNTFGWGYYVLSSTIMIDFKFQSCGGIGEVDLVYFMSCFLVPWVCNFESHDTAQPFYVQRFLSKRCLVELQEGKLTNSCGDVLRTGTPAGEVLSSRIMLDFKVQSCKGIGEVDYIMSYFLVCNFVGHISMPGRSMLN
jgi:hypothetical protein